MRQVYLFFAVLILTACSKEETYGPFNLKDGQEVELFVSHRYGAVGDGPLIMPQNASPQFSLSAFDEREPGYDYHVKAKMVAYNGPRMQDGGPMSHLKFIEVIRKEKYEGNETFELELIQSYIPGGPIIVLLKEEDKYFFISNIQLTYNDTEIESQLEKIWENWEELRQKAKNRIPAEPKWKSIRATVTHDPDNFGRAYRVHSLKLIE